MAAPLKKWTVLPHGDPVNLEDNLITVVGQMKMPLASLPRRMTVARLGDGRLVVFSAIALDEFEMERLEAFGRPAFLVVPNDHHRFDARIWKDRYPALKVIAPAGAKEKVEEIVRVDAVDGEFGDDTVMLSDVAGTRRHEFAMTVRSAGGTTLVLNDIVGNIRDAKGFGGWLLKLMGFAGDEPHIPFPVRMAIVDDKKELAAQLNAWAALADLRRIIVSHGDVIEERPQAALHALASKLG